MADIITYAGTGITYKNGSSVTYVSKLGNTKVINPRVEHNVVTQQSGILDYRLDDKGYFTTSISVTPSSSGVVSGINGHQIEVMGYTFISSSDANIRFYSGSTPITGDMSVGANGGASVSPGSSPIMTTVAGASLNLIASTGIVSGHLSYRIN